MKRVLILLCIVSLFSFILIIIINKKTSPAVYNYLSSETEIIANNVIFDTVNTILIDKIDINKLIVNQINRDDEIEFIDYDTKEVNKILAFINEGVRNKLLNLEMGDIEKSNLTLSLSNINGVKVKNGVVCSIPMGSIWGTYFLANYGPYVPVRISFVGDVVSYLNTSIKSYGINNVYLQVDVVVEINEQIMMPMMTKKEKITIVAPLFMRVIQGKIPSYYFNDINKESISSSMKLV